MLVRPRAELIGRVVAGRYRIDAILGRGGMSVVYAGTHTWMDRPVAVKVLHPEYEDRPDVVQRFFQEARVAANLRHPHVVDVFDMGESDEGAPFLAMERLQGETLAALLAREPTLEVPHALRLVAPVIDALAVVHERGILHRDLKPENVFLARDFRGRVAPKLLDFGVAKLLEGGTLTTRTGSVMGTPAYMSPEQSRGLSKDLGAPSDVWAIGMILYRALAGRLPFDEAGVTDALLHIATRDVPSLSDRAP